MQPSRHSLQHPSAAAFAAAYGMPLGTALAQSPPSDTAGHLVVYNFGIPELYQLAIDRFSERYPNVTVEALYIPSTEGWGGVPDQPRSAYAQRAANRHHGHGD